ncbi:MAG: hypothetical protein JW789_03590 [Candidatus Aenigmarchaeota archaeon]|nr:hypothetical protein [Candidatus Aenigmarchaeota archaeon]
MVRITEGKAAIEIPKQPVTRKAEAFYNPEMEYQRDITMSALRVFGNGKDMYVCDPLAGTGIRSLRMAAEVPGVKSILANDMSESAFAVLKKNIINARIKDTEIYVSNRHARDIFQENMNAFDFIDIDPFGSPIGFLTVSASSLKNRALFAATATDTGALCGAFPKTCLNRYSIKSFKTDFFKEVGIRTLITAVMTEMAEEGVSFEPMYSHANHYFRVIGITRRSAKKTAEQRKLVKDIYYCSMCLFRSAGSAGKCPECGSNLNAIGPLWTGKIIDRAFCRKMLNDLESNGYKKTKELSMALEDGDSPFFYDLHKLYNLTKKTPQKIRDVIGCLEENGFKATRTYLSGTGIRTEAPYGKIINCL